MKKNILEELREEISSIPQGLGLEETVKIGSKILGNPIFAFDLCYNLLTFYLEFPTDDWIVNELVTLGHFTHESVNFFNEANFITAYNESDVVSILQCDSLKYRRMNGKLFGSDNVQIGDLSIPECYRPFLDGEDAVVEILCEKVSLELQNSPLVAKIPRAFGDSTFYDAIVSTQPLSDDLCNKFSEYLLNMKKYVFVCAIDISQYDGTLTHMAYFRQKFEELCPEYKFIVGVQSIIAFVSSDNPQLDIEADLKKLNDFFALNRIFAGVSKPITNIKRLKTCFRQAIRALNRGLQQKTKKHNIFLS